MQGQRVNTIDHERTLTASLDHPGDAARPLLALTIVWHPDLERIGEQCLDTSADGRLELSRYAALFGRPGAEGRPLGHNGVSREPLRLVRDGHDSVTLHIPDSRMTVELDGRAAVGVVHLNADQIAAGRILMLGRTVLLCLHWMTVLPRHNALDGLAGVGASALILRDQIRLVARTDLPVLLLGETGTGKEVAARAIHAMSERATSRLVTVNMAALNESLAAADLFGAVKGAYTGAQGERKGLFGEASGATLFLDEIGNAPACVQPMLLRVLEGGDYRPLGAAEDRRSTARIIAATDQRLDDPIFNQALLRRLEGITIQLVPLRSRREDIGVLVVQLFEPRSACAKLPCALVSELACYDWPGNIRQLKRVLQRAALLLESGVVPRFDQLVPVAAAPAAPVPEALPRRKPSQLSEEEVLDALSRHGWIMRSAAQWLGISRPTLDKLLGRHSQIRRPERIPTDEIGRAWRESRRDVARCAVLLKTPAEPLRRHLNRLGLLDDSRADGTDL